VEIRKIALIGPESTGKSTLAQKLAEHFKSCFVPEYARQYLQEGNTVSTPDDLLRIAHMQQRRELEEALKLPPGGLLFCDTDLHNLVVWSQYAFGICDAALLELEDSQNYDLYLLLSPDLPWVPDGIRENPHLREELHQLYLRQLNHKNRRYVLISGDTETRFRASIEAMTF
jgi:NadR type nicotinamide-nucleotide adenylyltransferase